MAAGNFERCLAITLKWEGGWSNNPADPGGPTMRGVIQREYNAYRLEMHRAAQSVRNISTAEIQDIYKRKYWDTMRCDGLPLGLDLCVFDAAVNSGPGRAKAWALRAHNIDGFCDARLSFLHRLGRLWTVFGTGWRKRVTGIRVQAHAMMAAAPIPERTAHADATPSVQDTHG